MKWNVCSYILFFLFNVDMVDVLEKFDVLDIVWVCFFFLEGICYVVGFIMDKLLIELMDFWFDVW